MLNSLISQTTGSSLPRDSSALLCQCRNEGKVPCFSSAPQSAVYSMVRKTNGDVAENEEDNEHDYSSIAELKGLVPASSSSDLYATVRDIYGQPDDESRQGGDPASDRADPGYETIRIPKAGSPDDDHWDGPGAEGSDAAKAEHDYECVGELGLGRETSRL